MLSIRWVPLPWRELQIHPLTDPQPLRWRGGGLIFPEGDGDSER